jgi:transcriptional regulator with XRE-family HTH domain
MGLKERRIAAGYTIAELADKTGISYQRLWRLESGRSYIQMLNDTDKQLLADALGCDTRVFNYRPVTMVANCKTKKQDPLKLQAELKRRFGRKLLPIDHKRESRAYCFQEPHLYENF